LTDGAGLTIAAAGSIALVAAFELGSLIRTSPSPEMAQDAQRDEEVRGGLMAQVGKIGIAISGGPNPAEIVDLVVLAESLSCDSAWIAEGHGGDQFAILAACAMRTSRNRRLIHRSIARSCYRAAPKLREPPRIQFPCADHPKSVHSPYEYESVRRHALYSAFPLRHDLRHVRADAKILCGRRRD
jgi:hypothetical protein